MCGPACGRGRGLRRPLMRWAAELLAQLGLCAFERAAARGTQILAGAVDVEGQHRHGRAIGIGFASLAVLGRALERSGDARRAPEREDAALEIERVALPRHPARPAMRIALRHDRLRTSLFESTMTERDGCENSPLSAGEGQIVMPNRRGCRWRR